MLINNAERGRLARFGNRPLLACGPKYTYTLVMTSLNHTEPNRVISFLAALLIAISTTVPRGLELSCVLLLVYSLYHWRRWQITGPQNYLPLVMVMLFAFFSGLLHVHSDGPEALDVTLRYLLVLPLIFQLPSNKIKPDWIFKGFVLGGLLSGTAALYQYYVLGYEKVYGTLFFIYFANLAAVQGALSLCAFFWFLKEKYWSTLALLGLVMAATAMILSGTRGSWIALPPALLIATVLHFRLFNWKKLTMIVVGISALCFISYQFIPIVHDRVSASITEVKDYVQGNREQLMVSSSGLRFEMWRAAVREFQEAPLLGLGTEKRSEFRRQLISEGYFVSTDGAGSTHSELFDGMAKRGSVGIIAIVLLYFVPLVFFIRQYIVSQDDQRRLLSTSGITFVVVFMVSGLTERFLYHHVGAMFYGFIMPVMYAMVRQSSPTQSTQ